jgi:geranylgeranyl pyrophosphate synthase
MNFEHKLEQYRKRVEEEIDRLIPAANTRPANLHSAMRYSMEAGGKRLRPILLLAAFELFPTSLSPYAAAIAIECIHTYSLIHDDLPSIDNSDLRRGKPTCHKQFDEATALLAGDALLTLAFERISSSYMDTPEIAIQLVDILSRASGSQCLIGGQMEDIEGENKDLALEDLEYINENKTAALISASICMGGVLNGSYKQYEESYKEMGKSLGLAFQIIDDILDLTSDVETLGKDVGQDSKNEKNTIARKLGIEKARVLSSEYTERAASLAKSISKESSFLTTLIYDMEKRIK